MIDLKDNQTPGPIPVTTVLYSLQGQEDRVVGVNVASKSPIQAAWDLVNSADCEEPVPLVFWSVKANKFRS